MSEHRENMEELKRGRGRPKKDGARRYEAKTYFNEQESKSLENLSLMTGESKAELLRQAFTMYNNYRRFQLNPDENGDI